MESGCSWFPVSVKGLLIPCMSAKGFSVSGSAIFRGNGSNAASESPAAKGVESKGAKTGEVALPSNGGRPGEGSGLDSSR